MRPLALPLLLLLAAAPAHAQDGPAEAIESAIADQLADFVARDVPGAWEHASPMIQGMFGSAGNFGTMVENGYPMVWDNRDAEFLELSQEGGAWHQRVLVRDAQGRGWICDYAMIEVDGEWLIDGVQVLPAPELAA